MPATLQKLCVSQYGAFLLESALYLWFSQSWHVRNGDMENWHKMLCEEIRGLFPNLAKGLMFLLVCVYNIYLVAG